VGGSTVECGFSVRADGKRLMTVEAEHHHVPEARVSVEKRRCLGERVCRGRVGVRDRLRGREGAAAVPLGYCFFKVDRAKKKRSKKKKS